MVKHFILGRLTGAFTEDGQINENMVADRDRRFGIDWMRKRGRRADISRPPVIEGANSWERGRTVQTRLEEMDLKR
jgi:hypothetical protein